MPNEMPRTNLTREQRENVRSVFDSQLHSPILNKFQFFYRDRILK